MLGTKLSRKQFLRGAGMIGFLTLASACTNLQNNAPHGRPAQIVYQDWRTEWFPPMAQEMLGRFAEDHPQIQVFYAPDPENFEEKVLSDMQAGTAPDVFQACCPFFPLLAQKGYTLDLRPFVEADLDQETIDDWDTAQYRAFFLPEGHQFGLPKYHGALALYYNMDLFDTFRVDYPDSTWTYLDYWEAMRRLTRDRNKDGDIDLWGSMIDISWDRIQMYVNGWGGHFVDPQDRTGVLMCEEPAIEALIWLRSLMWDQGIMATPADVSYLSLRQAFMRGGVAMVEDGSWALKDILDGADFRVGVAPYPAGPKRRVTLATTDGFGIYSGTRHPEQAWELLKFLIGKEYGRAMARANFLQPARASLVEEWAAMVKAEYPTQAQELDVEAFAEGHIQGYSVTAEVFANMADAPQIAGAAWEEILSLGKAPVVGRIAQACHEISRSQKGAAD